LTVAPELGKLLLLGLYFLQACLAALVFLVHFEVLDEVAVLKGSLMVGEAQAIRETRP
jgi:hypothetical protein